MSKNLPEYSHFHLAGLFWGFSDSNEMVSEVLGYYPCKIYAVVGKYIFLICHIVINLFYDFLFAFIVMVKK